MNLSRDGVPPPDTTNEWGIFGVLFIRHGCSYYKYYNYWTGGNLMVFIKIKGKDLNIR
jgi:hypothetical protein